MKNIAITCFVLIAVCVGLQAKKVVKAPYFMATNTSQIEFEKVKTFRIHRNRLKLQCHSQFTRSRCLRP